jgi:hypothetical protein
VRRDFVRTDFSRVRQELRHRVVAGQAKQSALPHQVSARIADVGDQQVGSGAARRRHRRPHASQVRLAAGLFGKDLRNPAETLFEASQDFLSEVVVEAGDDVRRGEHEIDQRGDRRAARHLSGGVSAQSVGDEHAVDAVHRFVRYGPSRQVRDQRRQRPVDPGHEEMVLVVRSYEADVREAAELHVIAAAF